MNESKILRTACDSAWYAHAYSEYLADVAQNVSNLMAAIQECLSLDEMDIARADSILRSYDINPQARFIIGAYGSVTAIDLLVYSWNETDDNAQNDGLAPYSVEEAFSIIRGSWTQCVIGSKAFDAFSMNSDSPTARTTKFLQDVQATFQIDDTVRETIAYYQAMINASSQVGDFVNLFLSSTGVNDADDQDDPMAYVNSEVYKYTGNTPGIALDFSTVNKAVSSTVSVVAKTVKGVFNLIGRGVTWLFGKAKKYVVDTVIDPAVCEYISNDDDNEGYIDGFAWFGEFVPNAKYSLFNTGAQIADVFNGFYDKYAEKWIKIKLKVGEFLFRIVEDTNKWQCYFKPVAIDVDYLSENIPLGADVEPTYRRDQHQESITEYADWLSLIMEYTRPLAKDATKDQIYKGLALSSALAGSIAMFSFIETFYLVYGSNAISWTNDASYFSSLVPYYTFEPALESDQVTNKKILLAAAGDPTDADNIHKYPAWSKTSGVRLYTSEHYSMRTIMTNIISIWAMCRRERELYPSNYTFVPYSNNHTSFTAASWRIKSDDEIAETRDNFLEKVIIAAIAVAAVVFIGVTAIKISKNAFFKRQQSLSVLENKMWSGQPLTASERRKYIRYNRRQNASRWLSSGSGDPYTALSNDGQHIINLIRR